MPEPIDTETAETEVVESTPQPSGAAALLRWFLVIGVVFAMFALGAFWIARNWIDDQGTGDPASADAAADDGGATAAREYPVPDFRLASLDGRRMGPPDFEGQAVVIDFWASWCGPCKLQAKMLDKLHEELDGQEVRFLAINLGEDEETVREYVEETPFPYSVLLDPEEELMMRYEIYGLPTVMVIDREGQVSYLRTGLTDVPTLRRELAKIGIEL